MCPSNFRSNDVVSFAPKISLFVLKLYRRESSGGATQRNKALSAKPMRLIYPRMNARRLLFQFGRLIARDRRLSGAPSGTAQRDLPN